jgi:excisionase family DNA binding protein
VYIRQSSKRQVEEHRYSARRQYQMAQWTKQLGWGAEQIVVIDEDQGKTGTVAQSRQGFGEMIRSVGRGEVGIVVSLEVSRLSRNSPDWCNLIYLSRYTQTLISDGETVYDPTVTADRSMLGFRGHVSELEHEIGIGRMVQARWEQAERGEATFIPPAGYDLDELGRIVMTSDASVAEAIVTVFDRFEQLGNIRLVYQYFRDTKRSFPVRRMQTRGHPVIWVDASYDAICRTLHNPIYAGAYVYGRTETVRQVDPNDEQRIRVRRMVRKQWPILLKDHHPAYISFETFSDNQRRIEGNMTPRRTGAEAGPAREGPTLLQGLVLCGQCGRSMKVSYSGKGKRLGKYYYYVCVGSGGRAGDNSCQTVSGKRLDEAVVQLFLEVTAPAGEHAAALAEQQLRSESKQVERHWQLQIESAEYEAQRAERQYMAVDPENRVVARELERRWNGALQQLARVRERAQSAISRHRPLTEVEVQRAQRLGRDVAQVWNAPTTTNRDRKQLLRSLIEEVQVCTEEEQHSARIIWKGSATTDLHVKRVRQGQAHVAGPETVELLRTLAKEFNDAQISRILTRQGIRNKDGKSYTRTGVVALRRKHGIPKCDRPIVRDAREGPFTAQQAAQELGVSNGTVHRWSREGMPRGGQVAPGAPWRIVLTEEDRQRLTAGDAPEEWVGVSEAARRLGMPKSTVAHWANTGKLKGVRTIKGKHSRWKIDLSSIDTGLQTDMFEPENTK